MTPEPEEVQTIDKLPNEIDYRAWWFTILGVLLLRSGLTVTITKEEWNKAQELIISASTYGETLTYTAIPKPVVEVSEDVDKE